MPEYLSPGVYVEETSFRQKTIEGIATSTTGFAGLTRYGPVQYPGGPSPTEPRLITSFTEYERVYGGLEQMTIGGGVRESYLAHAVRAFFLNGGARLYVSRVFVQNPAPANPQDLVGVAVQDTPPAYQSNNDPIRWRARWPGAYGNVLITVGFTRRGNSSYQVDQNVYGARGVPDGAVVEIYDRPNPDDPIPGSNEVPVEANLAVVGTGVDGNGNEVQTFTDSQGGAVTPTATMVIREVVLSVTVQADDGRTDVYTDLAASPELRRWIGSILHRDDPEDEDATVCLEARNPAGPPEIIELLLALLSASPMRLVGGTDGALPGRADFTGSEADPDDATAKATGLEALGEIDDIAIVALPDGGTLGELGSLEAAGALIDHAERARYRIAVVDAPQGSSMNQVREFRGKFDSKYAAVYHPHIEILDPLQRPMQGARPRSIKLPASGFVCGVYARSDIERGVWKAPANEVVRGLTKFEMNINKGRNDVLNPEGINALRFFEGRGNRVWGARTMSSDPEWKYVNVRRFFIYLEHSIDLAMQWAVFEPNNERLWSNIRQTIEDFLYVQWINGALMGSEPDEAYFVRCDRTTMTQNDLDNGRLVCLIGVAPTYPAEFVIFRIGQWTADAQN